jgi:hypothetical protein
VRARNKTTGDVREVEAEGADYQTVKAGLLEGVPDDLQVLMIKVDRAETFA